MAPPKGNTLVRDLEAGPADSVEVSSSSSIDESAASSIHEQNLDRVPSTHMSLGPDNPVQHYSSYVEVPDEVYDKFPPHRKVVIVILLSFCSFLAPISSTSVLAATPEIAEEYTTTGTVVNLANAAYMLMMGISPIVWGPLSEVYGRRTVSLD
jgi:hypothetical protein